MASALDDEDLALSISTPSARRNSQQPPSNGPPQINLPPTSDNPQQRTHSQHSGAIGQTHQQHLNRTSQRLGQYTIKRTLGEGSFGKVKLAVHDVSGQQVALKIISRRKLVTRDMAGRIEREIQYLQLLRHPHIIKL